MARILVLTALVTLAGCQATYYRFHFDPSPSPISIQPDPEGPVRAKGLVSVVDGRRMERGLLELRVRLRLENRSDEPLSIDPEGLGLVGSDLVDFGVARLDPPETVVPPHEERIYEVFFPYPADTSLSAPGIDGVRLSLRLTWPDGAVTVDVPFSRLVPVVVDSYPTWSFGFGYGVYH